MKKTIRERNIDTLAELKRICDLPLHKNFIKSIKRNINAIETATEEELNNYNFYVRENKETVYGLQKVTLSQQVAHIETGEKKHKYESIPTLGGAYWECSICGKRADDGKLHKHMDGISYK